MRGVYTSSFQIAGLTTGRTLLYITVPTGKVDELLSAAVTNPQNETNEQLDIHWQKVNSLGTPVGTTVTPAKHEQGDQAAGSTTVFNVTASEPTYVANTELARDGVASVGGWYENPTPEERPIFASGDTWGLRLRNSPAAVDLNIRMTFREIG